MHHPEADRALRRRGGKAAWALILLAPICGELTFSAVGMPIMWPAFPFLIPVYGAGVLLIRELTVRAGGGWPTLIMMGLVYELAEDGLGLQALTSPRLYNAAEWGPRVFGFNLTYWESQVGYHIVFSVLIPILITNLIFAELRSEPYLRRRGLIGISITTAIGIVMLKVVFTSATDPGYLAPLPFLIGVLAIMIALSYLALRVIPRRFPAQASPHADRDNAGRSVPRPLVGGSVAFATTLIFLGLLMPSGQPPTGPAIGEGNFVYLPMAAAAILAITVALLIRRWSSSPAMTDRHRIWLAGGALVGHTLFMTAMVLLQPSDTLTTTVAATTGPAIILATFVLLARLANSVDTRARREQVDHGAAHANQDADQPRTTSS